MNDNIKQYIIDSRKRTYGESNNFTISFNEIINNIKKVKLLYASIPLTYYNIKNGSNIIEFNEGGVTLNAVLTPSNYNVSDLLAEIKLQMELVGVNTYTPTYDSKTMKLTITSTGNFELEFGTTESKIYNILGYNAVNTGLSTVHISNNVLDLQQLKYIRLEIPQLSINGKLNDRESYTFVLPIEENRSSLNIYSTGVNFNQYNICPQNITHLNITLKGYDDEILDLNGGEWFFIIGVE